MKINSLFSDGGTCSNNCAMPSLKNNHSSVAFKSYEPTKAKEIAQRLERNYGMICNFDNNGYLAECVEKTTKVFSDLFGRNHIPKRAGYREMCRHWIKAEYDPSNNGVEFNKDYDDTLYGDKYTHRETMEEDEHFLRPDHSSSRHPAHVFAHEYSHCAHWHHLEDRNGYSSAMRVWIGLAGVQIPSAIGRLITRFKLSNYAVGTKSQCDMCEFMAERLAQDVCNGLTEESWTKYKSIDIRYDNIFSRKWNYRYSSPQSYIDYFTQQVWNGDIDSANRVGDDAAAYLAEIESQSVSDTVSQFKKSTEGTMFERLGRALFGLNETITEKSDERNKIRLRG